MKKVLLIFAILLSTTAFADKVEIKKHIFGSETEGLLTDLFNNEGTVCKVMIKANYTNGLTALSYRCSSNKNVEDKIFIFNSESIKGTISLEIFIIEKMLNSFKLISSNNLAHKFSNEVILTLIRADKE